jgi:hypothetical protein
LSRTGSKNIPKISPGPTAAAIETTDEISALHMMLYVTTVETVDYMNMYVHRKLFSVQYNR